MRLAIRKLFLSTLSIIFISCSGAKQSVEKSVSLNVPCQEGINLKPMYGDVTKCAAQLKSDENFLKQADLDFKSRLEASMSYLEMDGD